MIRLVDPERHNTYDRNEMIFVLNIEESYSQAWLCSIGATNHRQPQQITGRRELTYTRKSACVRARLGRAGWMQMLVYQL